MQLREAPHQRKPDAQAALRAVERPRALYERLEDARRELGRHADPRIGDTEQRLVAFASDRHGDGAAFGRELERVAEQVADDLLDARRIGVHPRRRERLHDAPLPGAAARAQRGKHARGGVGEVERLALQHDLAGHGARRVEEIVGHAREMLDLTADHRARMGARLLVRSAEELRGVGERAERVAELVAEHGEELVLRAVGRLGDGARLLLALEELLALGLATRAFIRRDGERIGDLPDLADRRVRQLEALAPAERTRRGAELGHGTRDAAPDDQRGEHREADGKQQAAAVYDEGA